MTEQTKYSGFFRRERYIHLTQHELYQAKLFMMKQHFLHIGFLLLLCTLVFGFRLGEKDFWEWQEERRPEISREMISSGDWIVPHLNGKTYATKPPLYYWTTALTFTLTGKFDEFSARLPSFFSAVLGVVITYIWASAAFSQQVGLFSGCILATSPLYVAMARMAQIDMMMTMFTTVTLCCFLLGHMANGDSQFRHGKRFAAHNVWYGFMFVFAGLGTLTKNPIGFAVPLLAIGGFVLVTRNFRILLEMKPWWGIGIFLLILLPWYIVVYQRVPNFSQVFLRETIGRYTDPYQTPRLEPFYYYFPFLGVLGVWVFFLPNVIVLSFRKRLTNTHLFLLVTALTTFFLFSSVGSKKPYYLLPIYPVLSILIAKSWDKYLSMKNSVSKRWTWKTMDIPIVFSAVGFCLLGILLPISARLYIPQYTAISIGYGIVFLGLGIGIFVTFWRGLMFLTFGLFVVTMVILYLCTVQVILPPVNMYRSHKAFFQEAAAIVGEQQIVAYKYTRFDAQFYMQRTFPVFMDIKNIEQMVHDNPSRFFVITYGKYYDRLRKEHPQLMQLFSVVSEHGALDPFRPKKQKSLVLLHTAF